MGCREGTGAGACKRGGGRGRSGGGRVWGVKAGGRKDKFGRGGNPLEGK